MAPDGYLYVTDLTHGAYGKATEIESEQNGAKAICKLVNLAFMKTEDEKEKQRREYRIQYALLHLNIPRLLIKGTFINVANNKI